MIVPGSANPLLTASLAGYQVPYSLRFRASNSAYVSRTSGASPTDQKKVTYSAWMKAAPSLSSSNQVALVSFGSGNSGLVAWNISSYSGRLFIRSDGSNDIQYTGVFRDPTAWGHLVVAIDTTQATASDRVKVYWNGTAMTYLSGTYPSQNSNSTLNMASTGCRLMSDQSNGTYIDGYLAETHMIDGQALTPSSFGQTDSGTGVWVPKAYTGTYGTNGFYLKFADASATTAAAIGKDSSGNGNNWTPSGISVTSGVTFDQMLDTPTLNYPVWSAIDKASVTVSEANMAAVPAADVQAIRATVAMPATGKWYWETTVSALGYGTGIGIADNASNLTTGASSAATRTYQFGSWFNSFNSGINQYGTNQSITGGANWTGASQPAANDVIMVAVDMDNGSMWVGKNGTWFNTSGTANPATNTDPRWTGLTGTTWFPYMAGYGSTTPVTCRINFGQRAFSYTPPTGFKALNTANLPTPSIKKGSLYMDATLRTGTGATASVSSLGFQPNLVWIKSRSAATNHNLFDSTRGVQKGLGSNLQSAQYTDANSFTAFNSNGYSLGSDASSRGVNINTNTYVDWAWKEGVTPGFDVVTFAGTGSAQAVNHGLGVAPEFMIMRVYDDTLGRVWACWHKNLTSAAYYLALESSAAQTLETTVFNSTAPTSTQFTAGSYNSVSTKNSVAYLWASVEGFSKFGSYTGNGSTDGPFVWCGAKVRWLMVKRSDTSGSWVVIDAARAPFNEANARVFAELPDAEVATTAVGFDFLASGFKARQTNANINASGGTYIFAAFAENPFKYARAR